MSVAYVRVRKIHPAYPARPVKELNGSLAEDVATCEFVKELKGAQTKALKRRMERTMRSVSSAAALRKPVPLRPARPGPNATLRRGACRSIRTVVVRTRAREFSLTMLST